MEFERDSTMQECHECGKVGTNMFFSWLNHLCQHYFALCPKCLKKFKREFNKAAQKQAKKVSK